MTEELIYCPICREETQTLGEPDDVGTQFYKCKNGHQTSKAMTREERKFHFAFEVQAEQNGERFIDPLNPLSAFVNGKGVFKTALVAQFIYNNYRFKIDRATEILYYGDEKTKIWKPKGEVYLQEILSKLLGEENTKSHYINILHDLKGLSYEDVVFSEKLAVENGLLDVETLTLADFNFDEVVFHLIPVKYDPAAKCPNWEQFIKQVISPDDIATIQEWSGYLLLPDYRFHKLLWIHGEGRNGKGVWERTMEAILGEDNVSSLGLEEFDGTHRFALKQLHGKLFNPCSEPATNRILQTPLLKKATGQDTIEAEIKGKQTRIQFRNYAKITVIANKFPKINDTTTAFKERRLFIKFPNEFTGKDQIQNLEKNWLNNPDEKSGILNWMIEGLQRLLSQGYFTESKTQRETEIEFQRASDTISAFLTELGVFNKNMVTARSDAFEAYKNYCDVFGLDAANEKKFTSRLKDTPKISVTTVSKPKRERAWKGICFNLLDDNGNVTVVTDVTRVAYWEDLTNHKIEESSTPVTSVTSVTSVTNKATFYVKDISSGLKCDCGKFAVSKEIVTPTGDMLRRCEECLRDLRLNFPGASWKPAYAEMPSFDEKEVS